MEKPRFGLELMSRRYSMSNNFKGNKLSSENMNRTMKMKLKKIDEIRSARSQLQFFIPKEDIMVHDEKEREFSLTNYKLLHAKPQSRRYVNFNDHSFFVEPAKKQEKKVVKVKPHFNSQNLEVKMNFYLNSMINQSQQDRQNKLKEFQEKIEMQKPLRKTTYNTRNIFWKRMKRQVSSKSNQDFQRKAPLSSRV